ncbi:MAG: nucleotidyltransferase family protein [Chloroflexi bacterium]|nr:nucleotidyltransferase family protein [Chloroflexota bacterium]
MATTQTLPDTRDAILKTLQAELPHLRQEYGVTRLALYGSAARGEAGPESDVDLLVELARPLGLEFVGLILCLEETLGRKVDLATFDSFQRTIQKPHRRYLAASIEEDLIDVEAPA